MSYNFGQFRRVQKADTDYFKTINSVEQGYIATIEQQSPLSEAVTFIEQVINLDGNNVLQAVDSTGLKKRNYFLRFKVKRIAPGSLDLPGQTDLTNAATAAETQIITIKLVNTLKETDNVQTLTTIKVDPGLGYAIYDIVIAPNGTYNQIQFILNRNLYDYNILDENGYSGRKLEIDNSEGALILNEVVNVIDFLDIDNKGQLKQIGVQGPPGLQMCIDGEQIKIGRSGIYEINNGVVVNFIGFIVEPNDKKYFMLDYQY